MRAFLSDSLANRLSATRPTRIEIRDTKITGFCLRLGRRRLVWCWHGQINKKTYRQGFGIWPAVSADQARQECLAWLRNHGLSVYCSTPAPAKSCPTLGEVFTQYVSSKKLKPASLKTYNKHMRLYLAALHEKRIDCITTKDVRALYADLTQHHSPSVANTALNLLKAVYNWASAIGDLGLNDVFRVLVVAGEKQTTPRRDDVLLDPQIQQLGQQLPKLFIQHQQFILLGLLTGFRVSELAQLSPSCIDFRSKTITLHTTKNGRKHTLPLPPALETILQPMCAGKAATAPLFSNGIRNHASIISKQTGIAFSAHTLRRTFASNATRLGISAYTVKALLNHHNSADVTQAHYIHLQIEDLREPMERISQKMLALLKWGVA